MIAFNCLQFLVRETNRSVAEYAGQVLDSMYYLRLMISFFLHEEVLTGLLGVWGGLIRQWLHVMLPADAAERCNGRLHLHVLELPSVSRK